MSKKERIIYYMLPVAILLTVLILEVATDGTGPLVSTADNPGATYCMTYAAIFSTLIGAFIGIRYTQLSRMVRMAVVAASTLMVVAVYYISYETTHLFCLGILAVAYLLILMPRHE